MCEAIGEDFHANPVFLRVLLAAGVLLSPTIAIGAYFVLGGIVLLSRLLFPNVETAASVTQAVPANEHHELRKAA